MATTNMVDYHQLLVRNAQLETELRITKEQLTQARTSTQYMLDHISTEDNHRQNERAKKLQSDLDRVSQENADLKATLRLLTRGRAPALGRIGNRTSYGVRRALHAAREDSPASTHLRGESSSSCEMGDLLGLDNDSPISKAITPVSTPEVKKTQDATPARDSYEEVQHFDDNSTEVGRPIVHKKAGNVSIGLGICGFTSPARYDEHVQSSSPEQNPAARSGAQGKFVLRDHTGAIRSFTSPLSNIGGNPNYSSPLSLQRPRGPSRMPGHLHDKMLGSATYTEDLDAAEFEEKWRSFSEEFPLFSAEGYKNYYSEIVRPQYLKLRNASASQAILDDTPSRHARDIDAHTERPQKQDELQSSQQTKSQAQAVLPSAEHDTASDDEALDPRLEDLDGAFVEAEVVEQFESFISGTTNPDELPLEESNCIENIEHASPLSLSPANEDWVEIPPKHDFDQHTTAAAVGTTFNSVMTASNGGVALPKADAIASFEPGDLMQSMHASDEIAYGEPPVTHLRPSSVETSINMMAQGRRDSVLINAAKTCPESVPVVPNPYASRPGYAEEIEAARAFSLEVTRASGGLQKWTQETAQIRDNAEQSYAYPEYQVNPASEAFAAPEARKEVKNDSTPSPPDGPRYHGSYGQHQVEPLQLRPDDPKARRTVIINRIPPTTTLAQVLASVRGGKIVSANYAETCRMRLKTSTMETNTVVVIFLHARDAANFISHTISNPLYFFTPDGQHRQAHAGLSKFSTRRTRSNILNDALSKGLTRILYLHDTPEGLTPEAASARLNPLPLKSGYDQDGIMFFEFASMKEARDAAYRVKRSTDIFGYAKSGYLADPCERPVEAEIDAGGGVEELECGDDAGGEEEREEDAMMREG